MTLPTENERVLDGETDAAILKAAKGGSERECGKDEEIQVAPSGVNTVASVPRKSSTGSGETVGPPSTGLSVGEASSSSPVGERGEEKGGKEKGERHLRHEEREVSAGDSDDTDDDEEKDEEERESQEEEEEEEEEREHGGGGGPHTKEAPASKRKPGEAPDRRVRSRRS